MEGTSVNNGETRAVLAGELVQTTSRTVQLQCKRCGSDRLFRLFRKGFMREKIYPLFGYYPWKCKICCEEMMFRKRHRSRTREQGESE